MTPDPDDKEEGEIEDGEIIESGDEGRNDVNGEVDNGSSSHGPHGGSSLSVMERLYKDMESSENGGAVLKKKKKKRKKKRKSSNLSPTSAERGGDDEDVYQPKSKKARHIGHDRANVGKDPWYKPFPSDPPQDGAARGFFGQWSPDRHSPDENDLGKHKREKSPPGLYDSPYESDEDMGGGFPPIGSLDREGQGGRPGANRQGKRKRMRGGGGGGDRRPGGPGGGGNRDGGNKKRRNQRPLQPSETQHLICKFFLEGKCVKGEGCNYSHDVANKKMELCKFYLNGFCSKIESCIYLHNEFPCKFFHTGAQCYSAENCKFSHDVLTDAMRKALDNHLAKDNKSNNTPKSDEDNGIQPRPHRPSLLGSPPQHIKDMVMKKKIPSLFDLEIRPPVYQTGVGGPAGPKMASQQPPGPLLPTPNDFRSGFHEKGSAGGGTADGHRAPLLPLPATSFEPGSQEFYNSFDQDLRQPFNPLDSRFSNPNGVPGFRHFGSEANSSMDIDERFPPPSLKNEGDMFMPSEFDEDERVHEVVRHPDHDPSNLHDNQPFNPIPWRNLAVSDVDMRSSAMKSDEENSNSGHARDFYSKSADKSDVEEPFGCGLDRSSSSDSDGEGVKKSSLSNIQIPLHLPKKQRELFMRIQQREAANKTVSDTDESKKSEEQSGPETTVGSSVVAGEGQLVDDDDKEEKEKWYSSSSDDDDDDNDQPLAAMLKNLQQQPLKTATSATSSNDSSMLQLTKILQSFTSKTSGSSVAPPAAASKFDPRRDPRRDPRSRPPPALTVAPSSNLESRDPRAKPRVPPTSVSELSQSQPNQQIHLSHYSLGSTNSMSYSENGSSSASSRLSERLIRTSSRLPAESAVKPKPILTRKRSSASEEEVLEESHSKSVLSATAAVNHPIPYKLQAVKISSPNYSSVINAVNKTVDPKLLLSDPRLKKELANDFSVLSNSSADSLTSSVNSLKQSEIGLGKNSTAGSQAKVRVGQHRLGVATMPAPRIKTQSAHLKKITTPMIGSLMSSVGLLSREQNERSTTPPVIRRNSADKFANQDQAATPPRLTSNPDEPPTIQSPTAEPTPVMKFDFQSKLSADLTAVKEPEVPIKSEGEKDTKQLENTSQSPSGLQFTPQPSLTLLDNSVNFDDDDDIDDKSDTDLVIVEPEIEKIKKVKKTPKKSGGATSKSQSKTLMTPSKSSSKSSSTSTKSGNASSVNSDDKKKSIFMVSQVGDGPCIKITMIKPTKPKEETTKESKASKKSAKITGSSSFEDALNSSSSQKQTKKSSAVLKKGTTAEKPNKTKATKSKKELRKKKDSFVSEIKSDNGVEVD
ncbi:hypothetical protein CHUAL_006446 [Chamberlinius hualienensis]